MPRVSVIMPCYNAERFLDRSVGSLRAQSVRDWELIAIDDGSTDGTWRWFQHEADPRIHCIRQANAGVSAARNAGIRAARAPLLAFLDADDRWHPTFLEKMSAALDSRPDALLAYCGWQNVGLARGDGPPFVPPDYERPDKEETLFAGCRWPIHAALVRREAVLEAGGFDESLTHAEDYALWLAIATRAPIVRVPEVLAFYHFHGAEQASAHRARAALQHLAAQRAYLAARPALARRLGNARLRELTLGRLLHQAYDCYWRRDLASAQSLFRTALRHRYVRWRDVKYVLPALLPARLYAYLVARLDSRDAGQPQQE